MNPTILAPANEQPISKSVTPVLINSHDGQNDDGTHAAFAVVGPHPDRAGEPMKHSVARSTVPRLLDPTLALAADVVDDLERVRIANENRLRQMTRVGFDEDGLERGFGLALDHPDVARLQEIVTAMVTLEHQAILQLQRTMRRHPLGPWVKAAKGVGEKQAARLLAAIGDPYWNTLHDRPRTVSELWAYCGLHTLPVSHAPRDDHHPSAGGSQTGGDPGQQLLQTQSSGAWVAARRKKGKKSNWSTAAKMRSWNVAVSCIKVGDSPYREVYLARREATLDRTHADPCVRCGPAGRPAAIGTPWSKGHQHADGLRIVSKQILEDLWKAARDIHQLPADQISSDFHGKSVGGS